MNWYYKGELALNLLLIVWGRGWGGALQALVVLDFKLTIDRRTPADV